MAADASLEGEIAPSRVVLEACEHYRKQTWRNRCTILTASGPENLLIPVKHKMVVQAGHDAKGAGQASAGAVAGAGPIAGLSHTPIREVEIDYSTPWIRLHETAIATAYGSSAFFEHYRDGLFEILESREPLLYDLNRRLLDYLLAKLHLPAIITNSEDYMPDMVGQACASVAERRPDTYRSGGSREDKSSGGAATAACTTKAQDLRYRLSPKKAPLYIGEPYYQLFSSKSGFTPGLSIVDLLFNEGPDSLSVLAGMKPVPEP